VTRLRATRGIEVLAMLLLCGLAVPALAAGGANLSMSLPWWTWPLALFAVCFVLGIVAVPAGVGGGVLFVPIVGGFFPFHLDFVRGAGLLVAMASALAAAPNLMRNGLADLRLALPLMLVASLTSIVGALVGLALPAPVVNVALGCTIIAIVLLMVITRRSEEPHGGAPDRLSVALALNGVFVDLASGRRVTWTAQRTATGLVLFAGIGFLGGVFGVGAGWANVPVLNLVMGLPLKIAAGTSGLILTSASASATWMYLNAGAMLPLIAVPSTIGMMLGARIGAHLLRVLRAEVVRRLVIGLLLFAGARAILKGLQIWN
jgi:hypothetical protein